MREGDRMIIRPAAHSDVARMDEICEDAKIAMRDMGINQWQDGYPNRACWEADVNDGFAYVAETDEGTVAGMFALVTDAEANDPEPSYSEIDGAWLTAPEAKYAAVHRVGVAAEAKGRGIAGTMLDFACNKAAQMGLSSIRIDTHADNKPMQRALRKAGFSLCGIITLAEGKDAGAQLIAFEKLV